MLRVTCGHCFISWDRTWRRGWTWSEDVRILLQPWQWGNLWLAVLGWGFWGFLSTPWPYKVLSEDEKRKRGEGGILGEKSSVHTIVLLSFKSSFRIKHAFCPSYANYILRLGSNRRELRAMLPNTAAPSLRGAPSLHISGAWWRPKKASSRHHGSRPSVPSFLL